MKTQRGHINLSLGQGKGPTVEDVQHYSSHKEITSWQDEQLQLDCPDIVHVLGKISEEGDSVG